MEIFRITVPSEKNFELIPIFDLHLGSRFTDMKLWKKVKDYIKNRPNTWCYIGGDLLEFIPINDKRYHVGNYLEDFVLNADKLLSYSIERAVDELSDIKDRILCIHAGNHETAYLGKYGVDAIAMIAKQLGVQYYTNNHECFITIHFQDVNGGTQQFVIYSHHGAGSGQKAGFLLNRVEDLAVTFNADIYIMGHSHQIGYMVKPYFSIDRGGLQIKEKKRYFIRIGGFRRARVTGVMGYEEKLGYRPNGHGTFIIIPIRSYVNYNGNRASNGKLKYLSYYEFQIINFVGSEI